MLAILENMKRSIYFTSRATNFDRPKPDFPVFMGIVNINRSCEYISEAIAIGHTGIYEFFLDAYELMGDTYLNMESLDEQQKIEKELLQLQGELAYLEAEKVTYQYDIDKKKTDAKGDYAKQKLLKKGATVGVEAVYAGVEDSLKNIDNEIKELKRDISKIKQKQQSVHQAEKRNDTNLADAKEWFQILRGITRTKEKKSINVGEFKRKSFPVSAFRVPAHLYPQTTWVDYKTYKDQVDNGLWSNDFDKPWRAVIYSSNDHCKTYIRERNDNSLTEVNDAQVLKDVYSIEELRNEIGQHESWRTRQVHWFY